MSGLTRRKLWARLGIPANYSATRNLPLQREANRLVVIARKPDGRVIKLTPRAATAWKRMRSSAALEGIHLVAVSGFRSVAQQTKIIRRKLFQRDSIENILQFVAAPGCSEHHTGRALDIGSPTNLRLEKDFSLTIEYRWLKKHAREFGFQLSYPTRNSSGMAYEPWHWCWHDSVSE